MEHCTSISAILSRSSAKVLIIQVYAFFVIYTLQTYLLDSAKPRDWCYDKHIYSSNTCEDIIQQTVRAKLLDNLPNEIPYNLQVKLEHFDPGPDDSISALVSVTCPKKRNISLILRNKGRRLKNIAVTAEKELKNAFRTPVKLKISVQ